MASSSDTLQQFLSDLSGALQERDHLQEELAAARQTIDEFQRIRRYQEESESQRIQRTVDRIMAELSSTASSTDPPPYVKPMMEGCIAIMAAIKLLLEHRSEPPKSVS